MRSVQADEWAAGWLVRICSRSSIQSCPRTLFAFEGAALGLGAPKGVLGGYFDDGLVGGALQERADLCGVGFVLDADNPPHDVDALGVPVGVHAFGAAAERGGVAGRRRVGDLPLNVGGGAEFGGLVEMFGAGECPGARGDRRGEGREVC